MARGSLGNSVRSDWPESDLARVCLRRWEKQCTYKGGCRSRRLRMIVLEVRAVGNVSFGGPVSGEWQWSIRTPPKPPTFEDLDNVDAIHRIASGLYDEARKS